MSAGTPTPAPAPRTLWCPECFARLARVTAIWAGLLVLRRQRRARRVRG